MKDILITESDYKNLISLIQNERQKKMVSAELIANLSEELKRAKKVAPKKIPADIITMDSSFILTDLSTNKDINLQLVYPSDADIKQQKISVLAPIGTALLGYQEGDIIEWKVPSGIGKYLVKKIVYQPQAAHV